MAKIVGAYKNENQNMTVHVSDRHAETRFLRLREAVQNSGGRDVVSDRSGVGKTTLTQYMKDGDWKLSFLERIAAACNVTVSWLLAEAEVSSPRPSSNISDDIAISIYDEAEASAGFGLVGADRPDGKSVSISKAFLSELGLKPNHTIILRVRGDSMEPTLKTGDRLLLDTSPSTLIAGVNVFISGGQLLVKRLSPSSTGTVRIISDNAIYPPEEVPASRFRWGQPDGGDAITIIGRVAYRLQALS